MYVSANYIILSVRDLILMFSEIHFNFIFTGLMSFGNPPFNICLKS